MRLNLRLANKIIGSTQLFFQEGSSNHPIHTLNPHPQRTSDRPLSFTVTYTLEIEPIYFCTPLEVLFSLMCTPHSSF